MIVAAVIDVAATYASTNLNQQALQYIEVQVLYISPKAKTKGTTEVEEATTKTHPNDHPAIVEM